MRLTRTGTSRVLRGANGLLRTSSLHSGGVSPNSMVLDDMRTSSLGDGTSLWAQPVVQRKAGTEHADVPVMFNYSGMAPTRPEARVVRVSNGSVVRGWSPLTALTAANGSGQGLLTDVHQGVGYLLQLRDGLQPSNSATLSVGTVAWGVGCVFLFQGQSNMLGTLAAPFDDPVPGWSNGAGLGHYRAGLVNGAVFDRAGWHGPSNGSNPADIPGGDVSTVGGNIPYFMRIVAQRLQEHYGYAVPVGIIPHAYNAQDIEGFMPPGSGPAPGASGTRNTELFGRSGTSPVGKDIGLSSPRNVYAGDFEGVLYYQGEANAMDTMAAYLAKLRALHAGFIAYVSQFGRGPEHLLFAPCTLGNYSDPSNIENVREAIFAFEAEGTALGWAVQVGWSTMDLPRIDDLHLAGAEEQRTSMRRAIQTTLKYIGVATFSGRGPQLSPSASRTGLVATLTVLHEGGATLVKPGAGAPTGFYANSAADFSGTDIAVTAAITSANTVAITFPSGTTFPAYVKYQGARVNTVNSVNPDTSNPLFDDVVYPTGTISTDREALGLPVLPTPTAIKID